MMLLAGTCDTCGEASLLRYNAIQRFWQCRKCVPGIFAWTEANRKEFRAEMHDLAAQRHTCADTSVARASHVTRSEKEDER